MCGPPNFLMQLANRRYAGPALKRLGRLICDGVTLLANRFRRHDSGRGKQRAASPLACGAACSLVSVPLGRRNAIRALLCVKDAGRVALQGRLHVAKKRNQTLRTKSRFQRTA